MNFPGAPSPRLGPSDIHVAAQLFQPSRLTLARELRKLTKADLAARIGKTPSAISQFESGRLRPDGASVAQLALALDLPIAFFAIGSSAGPMSVEECHFRSLRSASQRDRRSLLARGTILCDLARILEPIVEMPPERVPRIDREVSSSEDIESVAERVRELWGLGLGPISNVVWLMEGNGIIVSKIPSDCVDVDAFSGWRQTADHVRPFVFLTDAKDAASRCRFDAAHELGHLVMHLDAQPGSPELERQANQFASAFLMPHATFGREAPTWLNWNLIWELKRRWRTSARAILFRSHALGRLSDASYRRGFVYLNQRFRDGEPHEPEHEQPLMLSRALDLAVSEATQATFAEQLGLRPHQLAALVLRETAPRADVSD